MTAKKQQIISALEAQVYARRHSLLRRFKPYPKQAKFLAQGATKRERLFMAANRCGKTFCGAAELAIHLTGRYPDWWEGRRFDRPISAWAASDTAMTTRDIVQAALCGPYDDPSRWGTAALPRDSVDWDKGVSLQRGVTDAFDTLTVRHETAGVYDGNSTLAFKSYDQGRKKFQGTAKDVIWLDEEPNAEVYSEALARIAPTCAGEPSGIMYVTFTPLLGMSDVVQRFLTEESPDRATVSATIDDAEHISRDERARIVAGYLAHEREARALGIPALGSGRIFSTSEAEFSCEPFELPRHWAFLWGVDFGVNHPFAAVLIAWDKDADVIYVTQTVRLKDALVLQHCAAMKLALGNRGNIIPAAWPQDGYQRREFEGKLEPVAKLYKHHGQRMCDTHAAFPDGSNSTEAGILEMQERVQTARLKVFRHLTDWFAEYRIYHRKDGLIHKVNDDLMSATRVAVMARRFAKPFDFLTGDPRARANTGSRIARGANQDPFGF